MYFCEKYLWLDFKEAAGNRKETFKFWDHRSSQLANYWLFFFPFCNSHFSKIWSKAEHKRKENYFQWKHSLSKISFLLSQCYISGNICLPARVCAVLRNTLISSLVQGYVLNHNIQTKINRTPSACLGWGVEDLSESSFLLIEDYVETLKPHELETKLKSLTPYPDKILPDPQKSTSGRKLPCFTNTGHGRLIHFVILKNSGFLLLPQTQTKWEIINGYWWKRSVLV